MAEDTKGHPLDQPDQQPVVKRAFIYIDGNRLGDIFQNLFEMFLDKLRVNVVFIALMATWVTTDFGDKLIDLLGQSNKEIPIEAVVGVLGIVIGTGLGGLIAAMVRMFESPQVPADAHERMVKSLVKEIAALQAR